MKSELTAYRERLNRFNRWEEEQIKNKTEEEKLNQFEILYNLLWGQLSKAEIENARQIHLQNLIRIQRNLRKKV